MNLALDNPIPNNPYTTRVQVSREFELRVKLSGDVIETAGRRLRGSKGHDITIHSRQGQWAWFVISLYAVLEFL